MIKSEMPHVYGTFYRSEFTSCDLFDALSAHQ